MDCERLGWLIQQWSRELGFQQVGVSDLDLATAESRLRAWLAAGYHGRMGYMARHGNKRSRPAELLPGTLRVLSLRMDYLPEAQSTMRALLEQKQRAYISRYALGRDYHKLMRKRLAALAQRIAAHAPHQYRVFCDSAPVLEKPLAQKAGLGWIGKHTNLLNRHAGSWFFLGEIYTDLPLPVTTPADAHCGTCRRCLDSCPTQAIIAPYQLDARRCISYLTIELDGPIPLPLRGLIGNRIYGCDDCQLCCPWNRFARLSAEGDFQPRSGLHEAELLSLFAWDEARFLRELEGSPLRRIGHARWLRNIAVGLGNGPSNQASRDALRGRLEHPSALVREHVQWALQRLRAYTELGNRSENL